MQDKLRALRWVAVMSLGLTAHSAWAGHPFNTEDAGVIAKGHCEIESFGSRERPSGGPTETGLSLQLGCGVIGRTQVAFALDQSKAAGEKSRGMQLSGKTQLVDGGQYKASFAVAYSTRRDKDPGDSWRSGDTAVNLVASVPSGAWVAHLNLGVTAERVPNRDVTTWSLAFERLSFREGLDAGFEFYGTDRNSSWAAVAARWNFKPDQLLFDASLAREIAGDDITRITVGFKLMF